MQFAHRQFASRGHSREPTRLNAIRLWFHHAQRIRPSESPAPFRIFLIALDNALYANVHRWCSGRIVGNRKLDGFAAS